MWVVVKIRVPLWVLIIVPHLLFRAPQKLILKFTHVSTTQGLQYPLIEEYTLNYRRDPYYDKVYSLMKGYSLGILEIQNHTLKIYGPQCSSPQLPLEVPPMIPMGTGMAVPPLCPDMPGASAGFSGEFRR